MLYTRKNAERLCELYKKNHEKILDIKIDNFAEDVTKVIMIIAKDETYNPIKDEYGIINVLQNLSGSARRDINVTIKHQEEN